MDAEPTPGDRLFEGLDRLIGEYVSAACAVDGAEVTDDITRDAELTATVLIKHFAEARLADSGPYLSAAVPSVHDESDAAAT